MSPTSCWIRPQEKREPTPEEIAFYTPFVDRLIDIIQPAVIVTLGRFAMNVYPQEVRSAGKARQDQPASWQAHQDTGALRPRFMSCRCITPPVVLYSASQKVTLQKDFEKLKLFI